MFPKSADPRKAPQIVYLTMDKPPEMFWDLNFEIQSNIPPNWIKATRHEFPTDYIYASKKTTCFETNLFASPNLDLLGLDARKKLKKTYSPKSWFKKRSDFPWYTPLKTITQTKNKHVQPSSQTSFFVSEIITVHTFTLNLNFKKKHLGAKMVPWWEVGENGSATNSSGGHLRFGLEPGRW